MAMSTQRARTTAENEEGTRNLKHSVAREDNASIYELLSPEEYPEDENTGHPYHGSEGGKNFKVDEGAQTFRCWRHDATGNVYHLVGIKEEIISCGEWDDEDIADTQWDAIFSAAQEAGVPGPETEAETGTQNPFEMTTADEERREEIERKIENEQIGGELFQEKYARTLARLKKHEEGEYLELKEEIKEASRHGFSTTDLFDFVQFQQRQLAEQCRKKKRSDLLTNAGIEVLGQNEHGEIHLFNPETKRIRVESKINDLEYNDAVQLAGMKFERTVADSRSEESDLRVPFEQFKREVVKCSRKRPLVDMERLGQGVHRYDEDHSLVVSGSEAEIVDLEDGSSTTIESPVTDGCFIGFTPGSSWIDIEQLKQLMQELSDRSKREEVLESLFEIADKWNFENGFVDQCLFIGGILQTIAQDYPHWRPHYAFIGRRGCGKSTLFEDVIGALLPNLTALFTSGSTEAGMRHKLVNKQNGAVDLKVAIRDEFENVNEFIRKKIMAWFRAASKGEAPVVKGTGDQSGAIEYPIQNSFWIGTTEFGGENTSADWSRFVRFILNLPEDKKLNLPDEDEMKELGNKLVAMSILVSEDARTRIHEMVEGCQADEGKRMRENHAAPLSFLKECLPGEEIDGRQVPDLEDVLETRSSETRIPEDREAVLEKILQHNIRVEYEEDLGREDITVGTALEQVIENKLNDETEETQFERQLQSQGIRVVDSKKEGGWIVFFHPRKVKECLQRTKFEGKNVKGYLTNFEEAWEDKQRIKGYSSAVHGVSFPNEMFRNND
jgi:energy-coupling factor transporter ATP-binding protein EcfA2